MEAISVEGKSQLQPAWQIVSALTQGYQISSGTVCDSSVTGDSGAIQVPVPCNACVI